MVSSPPLISRVFQIALRGGEIPPSVGDGEVCWGVFLLGGRNPRNDFDHIEHWLKSKLVWLVCTEYEL